QTVVLHIVLRTARRVPWRTIGLGFSMSGELTLGCSVLSVTCSWSPSRRSGHADAARSDARPACWKNYWFGGTTHALPRNYPGRCFQREPKRPKATYVRTANLRGVVCGALAPASI